MADKEPDVCDEDIDEPIDVQEVFDYIRDINDPEVDINYYLTLTLFLQHPYTLEQLNVVQVR